MNLPRLLTTTLVVLLLTSACIDLPEVDSLATEDELHVKLVTPSGKTFTNSAVDVRVELVGAAPELVELLVDGQVFATLVPPYTFRWNTADVSEGTHRLHVRAIHSGRTSSSELREGGGDRTPPHVATRVPTPSTQDVSPQQAIHAAFSEPLNPGSLTPTAVRLLMGQAELGIATSLSPDGLTLTVTPNASLNLPSTLTLHLTTSMTDMAGNPLVLPEGVWTWTMPALIPVGSPLSANPGLTGVSTSVLRTSRDGTPIAAWLESDGPGKNLYVARWDGTAWQSLGQGLRLGVEPLQVEHFTLALDAAGTPLIAWHEGNGSNDNEHIYVARWNHARWEILGGSELIQDNPTAQQPSLSIDSDGTPYVAVKFDSGEIAVYTLVGDQWRPLGDSLGSHLGLSAGSQPKVVIDETDEPIVSWWSYNSTTSSSRLVVQRWSGSKWEQLALPDTLLEWTKPVATSLETTHSGVPVLMLVETEAPRRAHVLRWDKAQWEQPCESLALSDSTSAGLPWTSTLDDAGNPLIAWTHFGSAASPSDGIYVRRCTSGNWKSITGQPDALPGTAAASIGAIHVDRLGHTFMAYSANSGGAPALYVYRLNR